MGKIVKTATWFAIGAASAYVAGKIALDVMESYRGSQGARDLGIEYQAMHAEDLGRPFPIRMARRTGRNPATPPGLPHYLM